MKKKVRRAVGPAKSLRSSLAGKSLHRIEPQDKRFLVVALGASAGGLKAFEQFFANMPQDSGMAFILIPHLDPSHVSMLPELLRKYSEMTIHQVENGIKVEPNKIYIIPPNKNLTIRLGELLLSAPVEPRGQRSPIDTFFRSLAGDQGSNACGVILSGTGKDGTLGSKAIKEAGGLVIAQVPASAEYDGMPASVIQSDLADFVLAPEHIGAYLLMHANGSFPTRPATAAPISDSVPDNLESILHLVRSQTGHDFSRYKKTTVSRRINRRMSICQINNPAEYLHHLQHNAQEVAALSMDMLIGVTSFFRDPKAFEALSRTLKAMLAGKPNDYTVRVWVPGCCNGEEVYSIGMVLRECMEKLKKRFNVQIFGGDIDADAIETARAGVYKATIAKEVGRARLERYFQQQSDGYHIKKEIREMAVFAVQDLTKDPPFTKLDLLSCRNVFIYLDAELQKKLLRLFHYALRPGGILFLGSSESIANYQNFFAARNKRWKIFRRRESDPMVRASSPYPFDPARKPTAGTGSRTESPASYETLIAKIAQGFLLDRYAPPCVLIDKSGMILYAHGPTNRYLALPQGTSSLDVRAMARGRLKTALTTLIRKASGKKTALFREGVQIRMDGKSQQLNLTATRYQGEQGTGELLLIAFEDAGPPDTKTKRRGRSTARGRSSIAQLEQELWEAPEQLQMADQERRSPDEELRSYNEELQSANEELQSMNEELETSKEELQSLNEELSTVNAELQGKIEELSSINDDVRNLLDSTKVATLFLDRRLCVKRFTPEVTHLVNLIDKDIGRPLSHFKTNLADEDLLRDAGEVLNQVVPKEREVRSLDGAWYLMRITPYRAIDNVVGGVVISFIDIGEVKRSELAAEKARDFAEGIVETVQVPLVVLNPGLSVVSANQSFYRRFDLTAQSTEGRSLFELNEGRWDIPELRLLLEKVIPEKQVVEGFTIEGNFPDRGPIILELNARRIYRGDVDTSTILLAIQDVTDRDELRALAARLRTVREEERTRLAREIHDELSGSLTALKMDVSLLPDWAAKNRAAFLEKLVSMSQLIDTSLDHVQAIVTELRPVILDKLGLTAAIEWQASQFQERSGVICETQLTAEEIALDPDRATAVFRIFQESLTNVARHADASKVAVELRRDGEKLLLTVRDNGKGIDEQSIYAHRSLGLLGMRERALSFGGIVEVRGLPGEGTLVTMTIPIS
jgi:two-component system, chemotaxis family, CheB/CheR fusion protein